jgi:hypothetical protein
MDFHIAAGLRGFMTGLRVVVQGSSRRARGHPHDSRRSTLSAGHRATVLDEPLYPAKPFESAGQLADQLIRTGFCPGFRVWYAWTRERLTRRLGR